MDLITTGFVNDGTNIVERRSQDVSPILDHTARLRNMGEVGGSEFRHAAKVPKAVIETYCTTKGITFAEFMGNEAHIRALLNDPDLSGFRIWKGRI